MPNSIRAFFTRNQGTKTHRLALGGIVLLIVCAALAGGSAVAYSVFARGAQQKASPTPADLFMQSVMTQDGGLGWNQLCPELQAQIPKIELIREANVQHASDLSQKVSLSMEPLGVHALAKTGALHLYLVTARKPDGWESQRIYAVMTRSGGCVADVQHIDPSNR